MSDLAKKTIFIPCISDHALTVAAAMRSQGLRAEVLPPPDDESMALGLSLCRGRECLPCFLCAGDFVRQCHQPGFDPRSSVFFMPTGQGPCRFGQYRVLQQAILEREGFSEAALVSPTAEDSYALFGDDPTALRKLSWQAIVAVDLLTRVLHVHRPYETVRGSSDAAYRASLADAVSALEQGGGRALVRALRRTAARFAAIEVDRSEPRPAVAVVGELYLMLNRQGNLEIVRAVEAAGGEVVQGTFMDWLHFVDWRRRVEALELRQHRDFLAAVASDSYQRWIEWRLAKPLRPVLHRPDETPVPKAMRRLRSCYEPALGTEATLTMGRVLEIGRHGLSGVINVLPFSCMPGNVVVCMAPRLRRQLNGIPWLDAAFDGQKDTNLHTRLGAFMHQAFQYHRRGAPAREEASA